MDTLHATPIDREFFKLLQDFRDAALEARQLSEHLARSIIETANIQCNELEARADDIASRLTQLSRREG